MFLFVTNLRQASFPSDLRLIDLRMLGVKRSYREISGVKGRLTVYEGNKKTIA